MKARIYTQLVQSKRKAEKKAKALKRPCGYLQKSKPLPFDPSINPSILYLDMEVLNLKDEHSLIED